MMPVIYLLWLPKARALSKRFVQPQVKIDEDAAALSREKQINKQIMQRKQETEWQLMAALSQVSLAIWM